MAESHVASALRHKRGEIAGEIMAAERRINDLRASLVHVDATLKLFVGNDANPEAIPPRLPRPIRSLPAPTSTRGDLTRTLLDVMRRATRPADNAKLDQLALEVIHRHSFAESAATPFRARLLRRLASQALATGNHPRRQFTPPAGRVFLPLAMVQAEKRRKKRTTR